MYIINYSNHIANTVDNVEINIFMSFLTFFFSTFPNSIFFWPLNKIGMKPILGQPMSFKLFSAKLIGFNAIHW